MSWWKEVVYKRHCHKSTILLNASKLTHIALHHMPQLVHPSASLPPLPLFIFTHSPVFILHLSLAFCSSLFAILLVPVIKEVWLPTVCRHSFFQTRIRHSGIGCMLSSGGHPPRPLPFLPPWLSLLPLPSSYCWSRGISVAAVWVVAQW